MITPILKHLLDNTDVVFEDLCTTYKINPNAANAAILVEKELREYHKEEIEHIELILNNFITNGSIITFHGKGTTLNVAGSDVTVYCNYRVYIDGEYRKDLYIEDSTVNGMIQVYNLYTSGESLDYYGQRVKKKEYKMYHQERTAMAEMLSSKRMLDEKNKIPYEYADSISSALLEAQEGFLMFDKKKRTELEERIGAAPYGFMYAVCVRYINYLKFHENAGTEIKYMKKSFGSFCKSIWSEPDYGLIMKNGVTFDKESIGSLIDADMIKEYVIGDHKATPNNVSPMSAPSMDEQICYAREEEMSYKNPNLGSKYYTIWQKYLGK